MSNPADRIAANRNARFPLGSIVHKQVKGKRRVRCYIVARVWDGGKVDLCGIGGAYKGSDWPRANVDALTLASDQTVRFEGASAADRERNAQSTLAYTLADMTGSDDGWNRSSVAELLAEINALTNPVAQAA